MFHRVLVPVDGSTTAYAALKQAMEIAKAFGADLTLVTVIDPFPFIAVGADYGYAQATFVNAARTEASAHIKAARELTLGEGLTVEGIVEENARSWRGIINAAESNKADLIVMGSHGRSGLDKLVMGSVVQNVLQRTSLPVLVVRG